MRRDGEKAFLIRQPVAAFNETKTFSRSVSLAYSRVTLDNRLLGGFGVGPKFGRAAPPFSGDSVISEGISQL